MLHRVTTLAVLAGTFLAGGLNARNVFVTPSDNVSSIVSVFTADPIGSAGSFSASPAAFLVLPNLDGSKFYVISRSGSDTLVVVDRNFGILKRFNFNQNATAGAITPDGRKLLVLAGTVHIIETSADLEVANLNAGTNPIDLAISTDGSRALVLSAQSNSITAIDLNSNTVTGTPVSISGNATAIASAPNGMIYASAQNIVYEIDPATLQTRGTIPMNATPGRLVFTPDGTRAVAANRTPVTGSAALLFDLVNRSLASTIPNFAVTLDQMVAISNNRFIACSGCGNPPDAPSGNGTLFEISVNPFNISGVNLGGVSTFTNARAIQTSSEVTPKFLYVAVPGTVYRFDLGSNLLSGQGALTVPAGPISYAGPAASGTPIDAQIFNSNQTIAPGGTSLPIVVRALDANANALYAVSVTFSTTAPGVTIQTANATTNARGFAQTTVSVPSTTSAGTFNVTATIGSGGLTKTATFNITTGGGGGTTPGPGIGGLSIVSGNGQVIQEQSSTNVTNNPLTVSVKDAQGNPVSASVVTFTVAQGSGFLFPGPQGTSTSSTGSNQITMTTDANGLASVHFTATAISPGSSYALTTIQASSASQTVTFFVTTALRSVSGGTGAASLPQVTLIKPTLDNLSITGRAGETLPEAIVVRVSVVSGPQAGQPVPNVGVQIKKVEGATGPTGSCAGAGSGGEILTDAAGLATCNLVLGGTLGTGSIQLNVGGYQDIPFQGITLTVTPGVPSEITRRQGDNQSGNPGQTLPLALVGEVKDRFGNLLSGVAVQWQVVSGAAQLTQTVNTTDANGRTSTRVTLGSAPGPTQIRVTAGTVQTTFTVTTNVAVTQLQIVSGSGQQAVTNQAFAQPLVVRVLDANGQPVAGATVTFAASGSVSLGATTAVTNAQGQASINATAGGTPGPIQVTATTPGTSGTLSVTFTLSSRLPGPVFSVANVVNAASNLPGVTPLGLATIYATGIAPNLRGTMMANLLAGPLPLRLADVEVSLGGHQAPILAVANVNNQESVVFQVPGELAAGTTAVTIRTAGGAATTVDGIPVRALQPGIFDTIDAQNRRYAVLIRPDGSFVTPENPARRGEQLRLIATGLGQVTPATGTNRTGIGGQQVIAGVVVGVNDSGVRVISAEYAENLVGAYVVTFEVPADTATGTNRNLGLAVGDPLIFGNGSFIAAIQ